MSPAWQPVPPVAVRGGFQAAALVAFAGTNWLALEARGFAMAILVLVLIWLAAALALLRKNRELSA